MRKMTLMMVVLATAFTFSQAQNRGVGVGGYLQAGNQFEQGGLVGKLFLNQVHALELTLSIEDDPFGDSMGAYLSYLVHHWNIIPINTGKLPLYGGPNAGLGVWNGGETIRFGLVGGFSYCLPQGTVPMDFFLQLNPTLEYQMPDVGNNNLNFDFFLQLGFRFFFG